VPLVATPIAVAWGWRSSYIVLAIPALILGIVLYILIGQRTQTQTDEQKTPDSAAPTTHLRVPWRKLLPFFIMSVATGTMIQSVMAYLSLYAVDQLGVAVATAAVLMAVRPAVGLFAGPFGGYLSDRIGGDLYCIYVESQGADIRHVQIVLNNPSACHLVVVRNRMVYNLAVARCPNPA